MSPRNLWKLATLYEKKNTSGKPCEGYIGGKIMDARVSSYTFLSDLRALRGS
jgi:hypothetical protein